jgi:hypothetical protein
LTALCEGIGRWPIDADDGILDELDAIIRERVIDWAGEASTRVSDAR